MRTEKERKPTRRHAVARPGPCVGIDHTCVAVPLPQIGHVGGAYADEHTGVAAGETGRCDTGVLQRLPTRFEKETLLRIKALRFARRDSEEPRVELLQRFVEKATDARVHLARRIRIGVVKVFEVPAITRHLTQRLAPFIQQLPVAIRRRRSARKATAHTDDRDRFVRRLFRLRQPGTQFAQRYQRASQCVRISCRAIGVVARVSHSESGLIEFVIEQARNVIIVQIVERIQSRRRRDYDRRDCQTKLRHQERGHRTDRRIFKCECRWQR